MWDSELELKGNELESNTFLWKDSKCGDRRDQEKGQNGKWRVQMGKYGSIYLQPSCQPLHLGPRQSTFARLRVSLDYLHD